MVSTPRGWSSMLVDWDSGRLSAAILAAVGLVTLCQLRLVALIQGENVIANAVVAESVVNHHAYWQAFQNRLLGPQVVDWLSTLTGLEYDRAHLLATELLLLLANLLCLVLVRRLTGSYRTAFHYVLAFAALFIAVQDAYWLYIWDFVDLSVMLVFAYAIVAGVQPRLFVYVYLAELFNREAAGFVGVWMILAAIDYAGGVKPLLKRVRWPQATLGAALIVLTVVWTQFSRARLFLGSMNPRIGADLEHSRGEHFQLLRNLHDLLVPRKTGTAIAVAVCCALAVLAVRLLRRADRALAIPLVGTVAAMVFSILAFGIVTETRIYVALIPFIVMMDVASRFPRRTGAAASGG